MLSKIRKLDQKGFTIIEVLIVLAIAGLIILVVFLAVPALQRNARNTQRNSDVSSLVGAMNEYINNSGGATPAANCTGATPCAWLTNAKTSIFGNGGWTATKFVHTYNAAIPGAAPAGPAGGNIFLPRLFKCNATGTEPNTAHPHL